MDKVDIWIEREQDMDQEIRTLTVSPDRLDALEAVATAAKNLHLNHRVESGEMWTHAYQGWELRRALSRLQEIEAHDDETAGE